MASLGACQARTPAGDLHSSQVSNYHHAQRARRKSKTWRIGTWNVSSMVDIEGMVAIPI